MINRLPVAVSLRRVLQAQPLQNYVDLLLVEVKLCQLPPNSLLLNDVRHQRPSGRSRFQILVVAHLQDDLPDAFFGQFSEASRVDVRVGLNVDLRRDVLNAFDGLKMRDPQVLTAQRFSPALLIFLFDEHTQLIDETAECVDVLFAVAYVNRDFLNHLQENSLRAARQTRHGCFARHQKFQEGANVLEATLIADRRPEIQALDGVALKSEKKNR